MALRQEFIVRKFVPNFERATIDALVLKRGKGAKLYVAKCNQPNCGRTFTVMAFQALNQFERYGGKFIPHDICRVCFDSARNNSTVPTIPSNVTMNAAEQTVREHKKTWLDFLKLRRQFEGRLVQVDFKPDTVRWDDPDPELSGMLDNLKGTLVALGKLGLSLQVYDYHKTIYEAKTYPREVVTNITLASEQLLQANAEPSQGSVLPIQEPLQIGTTSA